MSVNIVSFFRPAPQSRDWNNQELAEFYRVEASMIRGGVSVETDRGLSDEGDPWFVFCRADTGDVIIHFARIDGDYVVASPAFDSCVRGRHFRPLIESLIESHPLIVPKAKDGGKFFIHPAALLVALVTTCFFKLGQSDAVAGELKSAHPTTPATTGSSVQKEARGGALAVRLDERETTIVLAAIAAAVAWSQTEDASGLAHSAPLISGAEFSNQGAAGAVASLSHASLDNAPGAQFQAHASNDVSAADAAGADAASLPLVAPLTRLVDPAHNQIAIAQKVTAVDNPPVVSHEAAAAPVEAPFVHVAVPVAIAEALNQTVAAYANAGGNGTATNSYATQEVGLVLGGSLRTHLVNDLSGSEQQLVLSVAPAQAAGGASSAPADASHTTATAPTTASASALTAFIAEADLAISQFAAAVPNFQILHSGNDFILYDPHLTPANLMSAAQETFAFPDGSIVSLIGLPTSAHAAPIGS